jgi:hypothetical protein
MIGSGSISQHREQSKDMDCEEIGIVQKRSMGRQAEREREMWEEKQHRERERW